MFDCKLHFIQGIYLLNILFSLAFSDDFMHMIIEYSMTKQQADVSH